MIDLKDLRENSGAYKKNIKKKGVLKQKPESLIDSVLELDKKWRKVKLESDNLRSERNKVSKQINEAKKQKSDASFLINEAKEIPKKLKSLQEREGQIYNELKKELKKIPNLMHPKVPKGNSEKDNQVKKKVGKIPKFKFPIKNHVELGEDLEILDFDASAKVSGNGFYYLKGDLALLNRALISFASDFMEKKGYKYIEPPLMTNKKVMDAAGDLEAFEKALYKVEGENLYLIPTAEHGILGMLSDKTISEAKLPLKFYGYSMAFRKEIGAHGINEKGLWRTHQFNKVEQFIFSHPKESWKHFEELNKNAEEMMKKLGLPYRVIEMCAGDLGDWKARQLDIEVWRPTTKDYGETGSLSNCTDYQARDLNIKGLGRKGERYVLHTLNNTALATSRILVAIMENNQQKDGSIKIPNGLQKYMNGKKVIKVERVKFSKKSAKKKAKGKKKDVKRKVRKK